MDRHYRVRGVCYRLEADAQWEAGVHLKRERRAWTFGNVAAEIESCDGGKGCNLPEQREATA